MTTHFALPDTGISTSILQRPNLKCDRLQFFCECMRGCTKVRHNLFIIVLYIFLHIWVLDGFIPTALYFFLIPWGSWIPEIVHSLVLVTSSVFLPNSREFGSKLMCESGPYFCQLPVMGSGDVGFVLPLSSYDSSRKLHTQVSANRFSFQFLGIVSWKVEIQIFLWPLDHSVRWM